MINKVTRLSGLGLALGLLVHCGDDPRPDRTGSGSSGGLGAGSGSASSGNDGSSSGAGPGDDYVPTDSDAGPPAGTDNDACSVPAEAALADVSNPTTVVGDGSPESCTGSAFVAAVAKGGVITFDCGLEPVTITLEETAKIFNDKGPEIVIDGGGKVTLSGGGRVRVLYMNTCDSAQTFTTPQCDNQDHPRLTLQNLTFVDGNAKGLAQPSGPDRGGGGAVYAQGGRLKIINSRFFNNVCDDTGPDVGGGAVRALMQYNGLPLYVVHSTFGGSAALGNSCSNGAALSSIGVSYSVINSAFSFNEAIGWGANPAQEGTPGGGSGGAIYNDGNTFHLKLCGVDMHDNTAKEGGGGIFYVSNDGSGTLTIEASKLSGNPSGKFESDGYPGIFWKTNTAPTVISSTLE